MRYFRLSQSWIWRLLYSWIWCLVICWYLPGYIMSYPENINNLLWILFEIHWLYRILWVVARFSHLKTHTHTHTNFPNLFLSRNSTCFGQFLCPSSGVFHCTFGTGICHAGLMAAFKHDLVVLESSHHTSMTYTSAECTVEYSWWWAEELPETCRVSWQK